MKVVATHEAKTHLSALLQEVVRGETIVISRGRKPLAKLVPWDEPASRPKVGEVMDVPLSVPDDALRPMNEAELQTWGCDERPGGHLHVSVAGARAGADFTCRAGSFG